MSNIWLEQEKEVTELMAENAELRAKVVRLEEEKHNLVMWEHSQKDPNIKTNWKIASVRLPDGHNSRLMIGVCGSFIRIRGCSSNGSIFYKTMETDMVDWGYNVEAPEMILREDK